MFASRPELLSSYLILRLMAIVGFLAVVVLAYIGDQAFPKELTNQTVVTIHSAVGKVVYLTFIIGGFVGIFTTITRLVEGSLTLYHRVLNFDRYVESIPTDIRDAETEALVKRRGV